MRRAIVADEPDSIVLQFLRRMDQRLDRIEQRTEELIGRAGSVEDQLSGLRADVVRLEHRIDGLDKRMARVERRFDLVETK
jgi:phage shock protein A